MEKLTRMMRFFILIFLTLFIIGCNLIEPTNSKVEEVYEKLFVDIDLTNVSENLNFPSMVDGVSISYNSSNVNIITNSGVINRTYKDQTVYVFVTLNYLSENLIKKVTINVIKIEIDYQEPFLPKDMKYLQDKLISEDVSMGLPANGNVKILIIPIDFTDYKMTTTDVARLQKAFFGSSEDTGWESVQTYYQKSSYKKLNITGTILDVYHTNRQSTYYSNLYNQGQDADYNIIKSALQYYDSKINYADYDSNKDGYIDALYFIYSAPVYWGEDEGPTTANDSDLWWAYVYQYFTEDYEFYDGVEANYYFWAGLDFMDEVFVVGKYTDKYININSSTYIHETGHMLGLDDYYDYDEIVGPKGGLGGADMMDYTVGDHSSFSKIMMNWTTPYVISGITTEITLRPFESTGDVALVTAKWNNTYFDEYFLIDFYTPTGLNKDHAGYNGLFSTAGIRLYHIDATIDRNKGNPQNDNGYFSVFSFNNSDTEHRLISLIEADANNSISQTLYANNNDLFQAGKIFGFNVHSTYKLYNNQDINFTIEIISMSSKEVIIRIAFNNGNE